MSKVLLATHNAKKLVELRRILVPVVPGIDETHTEIYALDSADEGFADVWHTDVTFVKRPPLGSILRAVTLPPSGGDTNWADLELAYASLAESYEMACRGDNYDVNQNMADWCERAQHDADMADIEHE